MVNVSVVLLIFDRLTGLDGEFVEEEDGKKRRRAWELWSLEDKNIFFESINECGKDFEAIQVSQSLFCV